MVLQAIKHEAHQLFHIDTSLDGGHPADTRTAAQKHTMLELLRSLRTDYPDAEVVGHRDLPGVKKSCPCFDVKAWLQAIDFHI